MRMLDSSDALTPAPAVGLPLVSSAGHTCAQPWSFTQLFSPARSRVNSYNVKPEDVVRIVPRLVWCSTTSVALPACALGSPPCALATADALATVARTPARSVYVRFMGASQCRGLGIRGGSMLDHLDAATRATFPGAGRGETPRSARASERRAASGA